MKKVIKFQVISAYEDFLTSSFGVEYLDPMTYIQKIGFATKEDRAAEVALEHMVSAGIFYNDAGTAFPISNIAAFKIVEQ